MNSIVYVGMDVHKESYTLCCYTLVEDRIHHLQRTAANYKYVLQYLEQLRRHYSTDIDFLCGYEAGCLGYTLYHQLTNHGIPCVILAPTTMATTPLKKRVKTDKKDAGEIAKCLAFRTYSAVHIPTAEDEEVKEYIRMRNDQKKAHKIIKQQILSLVLRQGFSYTEGGYWTIKHLSWLNAIKMNGLLQESLDEYLLTYEYLEDKIKRLDQRIEETAQRESYQENVKKLSCLIGIRTHTALAVLVETGDFKRFGKAGKYASFLGLTPSEKSSGERQRQGGITKAGNRHLRTLLISSAQSYARGKIGHKSNALKKRQQGMDGKVIGYADKANERLRRKYYDMTLKKNRTGNVAKTAIARELACFIWGLMTDTMTGTG